MNRMGWRQLLFLVMAIPLVTRIAQFAGSTLGEAQNRRESAQREAPSVEPIQVIVSSQDAEGITQNDMGPEFLKNLESYTVDRVTLKTTEAMAAQGLPNTRVEFAAESTYVETGTAKLAVVRLRSPDGSNQAWIVGIVGKELKRVLCVSAQSSAVPVSRGPCAGKIREVFGVSFAPQDRQTAAALGVSSKSNAAGSQTQSAAAPLAAQSNIPLDRAARSGNLKEVMRLLDQGADPNEMNKWGTTALTGASTLGADSPDHTEIVRRLISHGADVNKRVADGTTALNEASFWGHRETAVVLLEAKADANRGKDNGYTPLISAASQGYLPIVKLLVEAGADLNRQTAAGPTALHLASSNDHREVVEMLLAAGARRDIKNVRGETFTDVAGRTKGFKVQ